MLKIKKKVLGIGAEQGIASNVFDFHFSEENDLQLFL